ncbi:MAG: methyltransferase type 11, partial [Oligoflexia bacterium]|nr:methyltransferase type 11 [Oligoflexia bacterium]
MNTELETKGLNYYNRLKTGQFHWWKQLLNVQAPYRWNIRRLVKKGLVLDIGCGIGRNLEHLDGKGVGVDHNPHSIEFSQAKGLQAFSEESFFASSHATPLSFNALLFA